MIKFMNVFFEATLFCGFNQYPQAKLRHLTLIFMLPNCALFTG